LPDGSSLTATNTGNDAADSDFDNTYRSPVVTLNPALGGIDKDNLTIDAGVIIVPVIGTFTDLRLTKIVSTPTAKIGDIVTYTIRLENVGTKDTTGVQVIEALFVGARYVSHTTTSGTYNVNDKIWTTGGVSAGATVELVVNVQIISGGAWINSVRINDPNGPPNDSVSVCLSAIIPICPERDEKVVLSAPADYSSYQWYNNNQPISGAIGKTYEAKSAGSYTVKVNNGQCPAEGCCPIVVAEVCECKVEICIPFEIKKVK
ncbi:MAG: DUF11 domain-containing protein, partial [Spirosomaceae bacterium]|nr:DUF11 domain-containing protein [Spirosomataceae bacterium]